MALLWKTVVILVYFVTLHTELSENVTFHKKHQMWFPRKFTCIYQRVTIKSTAVPGTCTIRGLELPSEISRQSSCLIAAHGKIILYPLPNIKILSTISSSGCILDNMEFCESVPFPFRRAEIPEGDLKFAEIVGVDDGSYFHITFSDVTTRVSYMKMLGKMQDCVRNRYSMPFSLAGESGRDCIIEYFGRHGGVYVRGKIIESHPQSSTVRCELIDDIVEVVVHHSQIYHTTASVMNYPKFVLKCKLFGMDCFLDNPYLKRLFQEYMQSEWRPESKVYSVTVLDRDNPVPTVQLTSSDGEKLSDLLQQIIPTFQRVEYPDTGVPTRVKITHYDVRGHVWFQPYHREDLVTIIQSRLEQFTNGNLKVNQDHVSTTESWKESFLEGAAEIFIYKRVDMHRSYRVQVLSKNMKQGTATIIYVDYGEIDNVSEEKLVPARLVDPNICLIPPQSLPAFFIGAKLVGIDSSKFNVHRFWKYVYQSGPVCILLKDPNTENRSFSLPECDILINLESSNNTEESPLPQHSLCEIYRSLGSASERVVSSGNVTSSINHEPFLFKHDLSLLQHSLGEMYQSSESVPEQGPVSNGKQYDEVIATGENLARLMRESTMLIESILESPSIFES